MICVFDKFTKQNEFNTCGERVLNPTSCTIHHDLNGDYSLELHQPILPDDDCYKFLKIFNIIKVSSGQLFPIYFVQKRMENGIPTMVVKARHIFYYWNDKTVSLSLETGSNSLKTIIQQIFNHVEDRQYVREDNYCEYNFTWDATVTSEYEKKFSANLISVGKSIMEACDLFNGVLYRDNFTFYIDSSMRYAKDNSFSAIHGWNMSEITETTDATDQCTYVVSKDNLGNTGHRSIGLYDMYPHHVVVGLDLSYDGQTNITADTKAYFEAHNYDRYENVMTTYDVNLLNLTDTTRAAGWDVFERCNIGDTGLIRSEILDIDNYQRIVSTDFNELTQKNERVKLANFRKSSMNPDRFRSSVSGYSAETKRISQLEKKAGYFEKITL